MIRPLTDDDVSAVEHLVRSELGDRWQVRSEELVDVVARPGLGCWQGDHLAGVVTYDVVGTSAEVVALAVDHRRRGSGIGGRLLDAVVAELAGRGIERIWLVTTNDNLVALALYQRHGFRLHELRAGAVDRARAIKPAIPLLSGRGIPVHDELVLEHRPG